MDLGLTGKVAIVTGAGRGIGKAYCLGFADEGARVVAADIEEGGAKQTAKEIKDKGGEALALKVDVTKWEDISNMVGKTLQEFGQVDILVNNAGSREFSPVEDMTDAVFDKDINVNLRSVVYGIKAVARHMKERRYGKIINMSSIAAVRGHSGLGSAYAAAKGGVLSFSRSMALELGRFNINVNVIAPATVNTQFHANRPADVKKARGAVAAKSVFGRVAEPEDLVGIVLLLASDRAGFITGQTIQVDGGQRPT